MNTINQCVAKSQQSPNGEMQAVVALINDIQILPKDQIQSKGKSDEA